VKARCYRFPGGFSLAGRKGFTLLEILAAVTIFAIMIGFLAYMVNGVQKAWLKGEQKVEIYQTGRAALELFARELSTAVASSRIQFVQSPDIAAKAADYAANSPSLFWMAPGKSTSKGNLYEFGYYLTRKDNECRYQLNRFYLTPEHPSYFGLDAYGQGTGVKKPYSFANEALWITNLAASTFASPNVSVVADGVVAMWIRGLDRAGNPIPWLFNTPTYTSGKIQFSSGASFQMAPAEQPFAGAGPSFANSANTFLYTAGPTTTASRTAAANLLPCSLELTLLIVDARSLQQANAGTTSKIPALPDPATYTSEEVPEVIEDFQKALIGAGVASGRTFTTRIKMINGVF
jgi:prepilin-type N-terminal cleavage/methylation domain-containing protein